MKRFNYIFDVRDDNNSRLCNYNFDMYDIDEVYFVCPKCCSEIYGKRITEMDFQKKDSEDCRIFFDGVCPLCKTKLIKKIGNYFARRGNIFSSGGYHYEDNLIYDFYYDDDFDEHEYFEDDEDYDYDAVEYNYDEHDFGYVYDFDKHDFDDNISFARLWNNKFHDNGMYLDRNNKYFEKFDKYGFIIRDKKGRCFYPTTYEYVPEDVIFEILKELRKLSNKRLKDRENNMKRILSNKSTNEKYNIEKISNIKNNPELLKNYMKSIIGLEMGIYFLSNNLENLYFYQSEENINIVNVKKGMPQIFKDEIKSKKMNLDSNIISLTEDIDKKINREDIEREFRKDKNEKPVFNEAEPLEPVYKKSGLFNKKKTQEENLLLEKKYNYELKIYNDKKQEYLSQLKKYENEEIQLNARVDEEYKKRLELLKEEVNEKVNSLKEQFKNEEDILLSKIKEFKNADVSSSAKEFIDKEVEEAEKLLSSLVTAKNNLYSTGIIYGKYQNVVIISSFYEYLLSGRCTTLEGPNGAYNIYEQEFRADMIISELNTVINSLEAIKKNQYMIYSELNYVKSGLDILNKSFGQALNALEQSNDNLSKISEISQVVAYNTEATAYYSKLNTELTNALGFLVALK